MLQRICDGLNTVFQLPAEQHDPRFDRANQILENDNRMIREGMTGIIASAVPLGRIKDLPKAGRLIISAAKSKSGREAVYAACTTIGLCQGKASLQRGRQEELVQKSKETGQRERQDIERRIQEAIDRAKKRDPEQNR